MRTSNKFPIIAITGPRQSGKTTLLKNLFSNYRYEIDLLQPTGGGFSVLLLIFLKI
ncbi:AAA family ATPase [Pedobacter suwonensis]|uniref:AAA family ATPase n=1 Tax=Pedobacter suwonensis TaxID=332999 RepID=UPI0036F79BD0